MEYLRPLYLWGSSVHLISGKEVMRLHNSRQQVNNQLIPLVKGKFQLQSEGAEIFFRNIKLEKISGLKEVEN